MLTIVLTVLGGIGLFLLGMSLMTEGLKIAAGTTLRHVLATGTRTRIRGLASGIILTGLVQSSSAVTVAAIGFVNAGLMTLVQAVWVIFGTNIGTTMTGWLVALVGIKFDIGAMSLPFIGLGMLVSLFGRASPSWAGGGQALSGFGAFFLGVSVLREAFTNLVPILAGFQLAEAGFLGMLGFLGMGILLTVLTQSSSAALAIALTANASGAIPLPLAAIFIVGANLGTTSTALIVAMGATPAAKRVAGAHIAFNLLTAAAVLPLMGAFVPLSVALAGLIDPNANDVLALAIFHTAFNACGIVLMWPLAPLLLRRLEGMFTSIEEEVGRPRHLDLTLVETPVLAVRALVRELERMMVMSFGIARLAVVPASALDRDRLRELGVLRLGRSIRRFIAKLQRTPLGGDALAVLVDVIRALQHLEELALEGNRLAQEAPPFGNAEWQSLHSAVLATLTLPSPDDDTGARRAKRDQDVEEAYEALKGKLLYNAASGEESLEASEASLTRARQLRRMAQSALRAERRIKKWRDRAGG